MSSILQWARSKRPRAVVDLGVDSCDGMSFSWSGITLFVDLSISPGDVENLGGIRGNSIADDVVQPSKDPTGPGDVENLGGIRGTSIADDVVQPSKDPTSPGDAENLGGIRGTSIADDVVQPSKDPTSPGDVENLGGIRGTSIADDVVQPSKDPTSPGDVENLGGIRGTSIADDVVQPSKDPTEECGSPSHLDPEPIKGILEIYENSEKECDKQQPTDLENCGVKDDPDRNYSNHAWPDWGEPLPPEEDDDDMTVESAYEVDKSQATEKVVTFSDAVTVVERSSLQEVRETASFSFEGSSEDELELGTNQATSSKEANSIDLSDSRVTSTEKEAAYHLLELCNELKCGVSIENCFETSAVSRRGNGEFYDPSYDLEKLAQLVEKLYAASPELSILRGSQRSVSSEEVGSWKIEVSKDSGWFRMKRIKRDEAESDSFGFDGLDDENDVLERPPWKRHYKSLRKLSKCG